MLVNLRNQGYISSSRVLETAIKATLGIVYAFLKWLVQSEPKSGCRCRCRYRKMLYI
jgi:hypothetical protein